MQIALLLTLRRTWPHETELPGVVYPLQLTAYNPYQQMTEFSLLSNGLSIMFKITVSLPDRKVYTLDLNRHVTQALTS